MTDSLNILNQGERCRHLLSKGMYINAGLAPGDAAAGDGYFWCGKTQSVKGPDKKYCDGTSCTDSHRDCYEET